ncbi:MAG: hypothetical protein ACLUUO_00890 [Sellimonas intestinalis]
MNEAREFKFDEISVFCIIRDLLKNLWVILLAAAAAWLAVTGTDEFPVCTRNIRPRRPWRSTQKVAAAPTPLSP